MKGLRVKRCEALVEDDEVGVLEQRPGNVEATALAVRELPTGLADHLQQSGRHAVDKVSEAKLAAEGFGLPQILGRRRPAAAHEQVEGEGAREDVVFVKLRRPHDTPAPALRAQCLPVKALEEQETRLRQAQANKEGGKGRLAAAGRAFKEDAVAHTDLQTARPQNRLAVPMVAEDEVARIEHRLAVFTLASVGAERHGAGRWCTGLRTRSGVEEEGDLLPGDHRAHQI